MCVFVRVCVSVKDEEETREDAGKESDKNKKGMQRNYTHTHLCMFVPLFDNVKQGFAR